MNLIASKKARRVVSKHHNCKGDSTMARKEIHQTLCYLPRKIVSLHGTEHVADMVLHELCSASCFNFSKAAYFVDNPDFDCIKGVAGFCRDESSTIDSAHQDPAQLCESLCSLPFNQKVRCCMKKSANNKHTLDNSDIAQLANELGMQRPQVYKWDSKHDNHGLLLYEKDENDDIAPDDLHNGLILLSFCPMH